MNFIVVGLGNPGEEYNGTRHNTGRFFATEFAETNNLSGFEEDLKMKSQVSEGSIGKDKVKVILPDTFMNKSGLAVEKVKDLKPKVKDKKKVIENLIVIHDELDLPLGRFKISFNKSAGGHRGVQSLVRSLKTEGFVRIRVGISPAGAKGKIKKPSGEEAVIDHILGKFKPAELTIMKKIAKDISGAIGTIISEGREVAMGKFNSL